MLASVWQYENLRKLYYSNIQYWRRSSSYKRKKFGLWEQIKDIYESFSPGQRIILPLIFGNTVVFFLWKVSHLRPFLIKYFLSHPSSNSFAPLLGSLFSHYNPVHLFCNMFVLWTFGDVIHSTLGKEQFYATYLSSGVIANLGSYAFKILSKSNSFSLGASGCLMGILGVICYKNPDIRLSILFLPFFSFSAITGLKAILIADTAGVLLRWRTFDHAAHLSGALFGIFYAAKAHKWLWDDRAFVLRRWKAVRKKLFGKE